MGGRAAGDVCVKISVLYLQIYFLVIPALQAYDIEIETVALLAHAIDKAKLGRHYLPF